MTVADWAVGEARFAGFFEMVSKGHLNDDMKALAEYIDMQVQEREGLKPFIHVVDSNGRHVLAIVRDELVEATEAAADAWQRLRGMATLGREENVAADANRVPATEEAAKKRPEPSEAEVAVYERVTARLLELSGYGRDTEFFKQSLKEFVTREPESNAD